MPEEIDFSFRSFIESMVNRDRLGRFAEEGGGSSAPSAPTARRRSPLVGDLIVGATALKTYQPPDTPPTSREGGLRALRSEREKTTDPNVRGLLDRLEGPMENASNPEAPVDQEWTRLRRQVAEIERQEKQPGGGRFGSIKDTLLRQQAAVNRLKNALRNPALNLTQTHEEAPMAERLHFITDSEATVDMGRGYKKAGKDSPGSPGVPSEGKTDGRGDPPRASDPMAEGRKGLQGSANRAGRGSETAERGSPSTDEGVPDEGGVGLRKEGDRFTVQVGTRRKAISDLSPWEAKSLAAKARGAAKVMLVRQAGKGIGGGGSDMTRPVDLATNRSPFQEAWVKRDQKGRFSEKLGSAQAKFREAVRGKPGSVDAMETSEREADARGDAPFPGGPAARRASTRGQFKIPAMTPSQIDEFEKKNGPMMPAEKRAALKAAGMDKNTVKVKGADGKERDLDVSRAPTKAEERAMESAAKSMTDEKLDATYHSLKARRAKNQTTVMQESMLRRVTAELTRRRDRREGFLPGKDMTAPLAEAPADLGRGRAFVESMVNRDEDGRFAPKPGDKVEVEVTKHGAVQGSKNPTMKKSGIYKGEDKHGQAVVLMGDGGGETTFHKSKVKLFDPDEIASDNEAAGRRRAAEQAKAVKTMNTQQLRRARSAFASKMTGDPYRLAVVRAEMKKRGISEDLNPHLK